MENNAQIIIVGGGLAGLTAAIHLLQKNYSVLLFEKNEYPKHKVCGEFISNEVLSYYENLNVDIASLRPTTITKAELSTRKGNKIKTTLPLGGFGISRYALDNYLYEKVMALGGKVHQEQVNEIHFSNDSFHIKTDKDHEYSSTFVLSAFGKRSNLDKEFQRDFIQKKSPWLAVKAHYTGEFPDDIVGLYNFEGGYCGVSKVENNIINICYIVKYATFKKHKTIEEFTSKELCKNPILNTILQNSSMVFEKPLTISQISFENKLKTQNHILFMGDAAGLIHPLCGNGMAMAIHSAKIACDLLQEFYEKKWSRTTLEQNYTKEWNYFFKSRIQFGKRLSKILLNPYLSSILMQTISLFPFLVPLIIKKTHGKPF